MSYNVFRDIGFGPVESNDLLLKATLFEAVKAAVAQKNLTQIEIAMLIGTDQPKVSKILRDNWETFSVQRLIVFLQRLGYDIHVSVVPSKSDTGEILIGEIPTSPKIPKKTGIVAEPSVKYKPATKKPRKKK